MTSNTREPVITVGLIERQARVAVTLEGAWQFADGGTCAPGRYAFESTSTGVLMDGRDGERTAAVHLQPADDARFSLSAVVGHQFHWSEAETQFFHGALRIAAAADGLTVINEVPLETYLTSVVCSEMAADCPLDLIKAHAVISRSWLLAQREARGASARSANAQGLRWYDQTAHTGFDVCAEDHCQRYHGLNRVSTDNVLRAIRETRGQILQFKGQLCDARYSKCCGGLTEDARSAWGDDAVPYLVSFFDGPGDATPQAQTEQDFRRFLEATSTAFCCCDEAAVLDLILPERDRRTTPDFFRWEERLSAERVSELVADNLNADLGRITALRPVARGPSGRLWQLEIVGERGRRTVGKELEIRRVLSASHLLSSAFVVEPSGPSDRPDTFVLRGAGWGHGVGLCQIGAAVMAVGNYDYLQILAHYYPGTTLANLYS